MDSNTAASSGFRQERGVEPALSYAIFKILSDRRWSLRRLALECGISYAHMRRLRDGAISDPGIDVVLRLAEIGRLSLDRMFELPSAARAELSLAAAGVDDEIALALARIDVRLAELAELIEAQSPAQGPEAAGEVGQVRRRLIRGFLKYLEEFKQAEDGPSGGNTAAAG